MSYNLHLKGDRIIPTDDFQVPISNQSSLFISELPPLNVGKKRTSRIVSMPLTHEKRYTSVPAPTSLDQNKTMTLQHETADNGLKSNHDRRFFSGIAKRVSSLGDNFNKNVAHPKRYTSHELKIPDITINDIKDDICIPLVAKFSQTPARKSWLPKVIAKHVTGSPSSLEYAASSSSSYCYPASFVDNIYEENGDESFEKDIEEEYINMDQKSSVLMTCNQISDEISSSASSILSSVLNTYGDLNYYNDKNLHLTEFVPSVLKPGFVSHINHTSLTSNTISVSENSDSLFSKLITTSSSDASCYDNSSITDNVSTLPTAMYNVKMKTVPSNDFDNGKLSGNHSNLEANVSLSPPSPNQETCVSPSLDSVYYSCHSSSSSQYSALSKIAESVINGSCKHKSLSQVYPEEKGQDLHRSRSVLYNSQRIHFNDERSKASNNVKRISSEQYCHSVQILPSLLNGADM